MSVRLRRLPEYGVVLEVFSGVITLELLYRHLSLMREGDPPRFLVCFDRTADLTSLTVETISDFRHATSARFRELNFENVLVAFVSAEGPNTQLLEFWCRYVQLMGDQRHTPALFSGLNSACAWLGLPEAAREAITEEIEAHADAGRASEAEREGKFPEQRIRAATRHRPSVRPQADRSTGRLGR